MEFYIERFRGIEEKRYTCEVVTPLFMAGNDQTEAEIRGPSIKGLLRFWWRANYEGELEDMRKDEGRLFGRTGTKPKPKCDLKSKVDLRIEKVKIKDFQKIPKGKTFKVARSDNDIITYLRYGATKRSSITPGLRFDVVLQVKKESLAEVDTAMCSLLSIGGMGAKSRNGFGSIHCDSCSSFVPKTIHGSPAEYVRFSDETRYYETTKTFSTWEDALSEVGLAYREAKFPKSIKGRLSKPLFLHVAKEGNYKYKGLITVFPIISEENDKYNYKKKIDKFLITLSGNPALKEVKP